MTILIVLFPLSMSNWGRKKSFSNTQWLHLGCAFLFTFDMIRRSPHSQVFNPVVIVYFMLDRLAGYLWYRTGSATIIHKEVLDEDYLVLFLYIPNGMKEKKCGSG